MVTRDRSMVTWDISMVTRIRNMVTWDRSLVTWDKSMVTWDRSMVTNNCIYLVYTVELILSGCCTLLKGNIFKDNCERRNYFILRFHDFK